MRRAIDSFPTMTGRLIHHISANPPVGDGLRGRQSVDRPGVPPGQVSAGRGDSAPLSRASRGGQDRHCPARLPRARRLHCPHQNFCLQQQISRAAMSRPAPCRRRPPDHARPGQACGLPAAAPGSQGRGPSRSSFRPGAARWRWPPAARPAAWTAPWTAPWTAWFDAPHAEVPSGPRDPAPGRIRAARLQLAAPPPGVVARPALSSRGHCRRPR